MKILVLLAFLLTSSLMYGQSKHAVQASSKDKTAVETEDFSTHNVWGSSSFSINLQGDVRNSSLFSVGTFYDLASGPNFAVPISVDLGFGQTDSLSVQKGASIGVSPWIVAYNKDGLEVVVHGALKYQMPNLADVSSG